MTNFQDAKDRAIKRAMRDGAATYIDRLIEQVGRQVPDSAIFSKQDVIDLLAGMADGMRGDQS